MHQRALRRAASPRLTEALASGLAADAQHVADLFPRRALFSHHRHDVVLDLVAQLTGRCDVVEEAPPRRIVVLESERGRKRVDNPRKTSVSAWGPEHPSPGL